MQLAPSLSTLHPRPRPNALPVLCTGFNGTHRDCVDVTLMASEGLSAHTAPDVPQLRGEEGGREGMGEYENFTHLLIRSLRTFDVASHAPDTNEFPSGPTDRLMTSPVWPWNAIVCCPLSMSHSPL